MQVIKPRALRPGQTIGLVAPSFALEKPEALGVAVAHLEARGYAVVVGESCRARYGYLAGPDALRAGDINRMFADIAIDAIFCLRGGYGATRILDRVDYDAIRAHPKVFSGYSDITALHSAIREKTGLVTFHGLMPGADMTDENNDPFSLDAFFRIIGDSSPAGDILNPPEFPRRAIVSGKASGPLIGGNLSLVTACLGTPYAYDFDGAILFLEEIGERTYAVDRMLTQLRGASVFDRITGIVLGEFTDCGTGGNDSHFCTEEVIEDLLGGLHIPVLSGLRCGHVTPKLTLPIGVQCEMDSDAGRLAILEGAVQ